MKANVMTKTLSLAVLGLAGMSFAGGAMAQGCTATWGANQTPPGVWSTALQTQAAASIVTPGLAGTNCAIQVALNQNSSASAKAGAVDQTPNAEQRYRARFVLSTAIALTQLNRSALIFNVVGPTAAPGGTQNALQIFMIGTGSARGLRFLVGDTAAAGQYRQVDVALPNQAGENRVEIDLTFGASNGQLRYWVSNQSTATTDGAPTGTVTGLANNAWGGVDQAVLGLAGANNQWRTNFTATDFIKFDEFDSRRQSFIGQ
ncbi:MAG TPA: Ig-like domain-containing protein [Tahibacter sp.]|uniref:Ig-like domain-containing protein n=1 Tax=Tahibacter sp. TaxID=2056211 RepID=UPI002B86239B|nr:Ig-like domain-containing protein [Tahibacter sp.]HSX61185.1 Ig-like domain-containing protein [Tahibacter sp.]